MSYPHKGTLNRFLFKSPLVAWRLGLGPLLSHPVLRGSKMLVLSTWGRKSNLPRHTMLSYIQVDEQTYVASGWGAASDWYKNILANPSVNIQARGKVYTARARRVADLDEYTRIVDEMLGTGGDSHFEPWLASYGISPDRDDMLAKRERLYFIAFDPYDDGGPPPLRVDLQWVWGLTLIILIFAAIWLLSRRSKA